MKLFKNFLSLAGAEVFSKLLTFAAFAYLARTLGVSDFGYIEFAGAVLMCASLIVDQGFSPYGAREIAKTPEKTGRLAAEVITVRAVLAAAGYLAIVLFALLMDRGPVMMRLLLVYGLSLWAMPLMLQWVFQGHERMDLVAAVQVIRQTIFAATVFVFLRRSDQILMVAWAEVAGVTSAALFSFWMYRRHFGASTRIRPAVSARLFREGVPIGLSQMFWVVKMFGGTLILGLIASAQEVGVFAGAQRILVALHTFVWLYYFNLLPSMSRSWQLGDGSFSRLIERSMHGVVWVGVTAGLAWVLFANDVMLFVYGPEFGSGGGVLALMAGVCVMAFINGHYRFGLIAAGYQSTEMLITALGAVVALVLIPIGYFSWGLNGAALGLVVTETVIWLGAWLSCYRLLGLKGHENLLARPLIAVLLASGIWWLPLESARARAALSLLLLVMVALFLDPTVRERLRELVTLRRNWSARRLSEGLAKAQDGIKA
ncbi:MAG: flippase [Pyrinomonadaceae bacterium]|nr:flippase [Pyrinomonadaceae bacterium]